MIRVSLNGEWLGLMNEDRLGKDGRTADEPLQPVEPKEVYRVLDDERKSLIHRRLFPHLRFDRACLFKWLPFTSDVEGELVCLRTLASEPSFYRFPWFYPDPLPGERCSNSGSPKKGSVLLLEYIKADTILEHFKKLCVSALDDHLVLLQYATAFVQVMDTVKALHRYDPPLFHLDIKPDNLLFKNNLLKIIDFDSASLGLKTRANLGTARYLPSYALEARCERQNLQHLDVVDVHLAVITFLEILAQVFQDEIAIPTGVTDTIAEKERISATNEAPRTKYQRYIQADASLRRALKDWRSHLPNNAILQAFSCLETRPSDSDAYERCLQLTQAPAEDVYHAIIELTTKRPQPKTSIRLHVNTLPKDFAKNLEVLLSSFTLSLFSTFYPLIYLDYSETSALYDDTAREAAAEAIKQLPPDNSRAMALDVGAGFGTGAYWAATNGFERVYCLDNNPSFQQIADLVWAEAADERWETSVNQLLGQDFLSLASAYRGVSVAEAHDHFLTLFRKKQVQFSQRTHQIADWWLADYWSLGEKLFAISAGERSAEFQYILCNNFVHWPANDFSRLQKATKPGLDAFDLQRGHLRHLLWPLLKSLASPGVLAIVEPSQFFEDDTHPPDDAAFHELRFTRKPFYLRIHEKVRQSLLQEYFGFAKPPVPAREVKFRRTDLEKAVRQESEQFQVVVRKCPMEKTVDWRIVVLGEFAMTMRDFTESELGKMASGDLKGFYRRFRELLEEQPDLPRTLTECIYIICVVRA